MEGIERNVTHFGEHEEFTLLLHEIYQTFEMEKKNMLGSIYDLFPDTMPDTDMRKKRGLFNIFGRSLHVLAGIATSDELQTLSRQVSQAMAASSSGTAGITTSSQHAGIYLTTHQQTY